MPDDAESRYMCVEEVRDREVLNLTHRWKLSDRIVEKCRLHHYSVEKVVGVVKVF